MAFCNKCGTELAADDLFCPKCGNKTVIEEAVTSAPELPSMTKEEMRIGTLRGKIDELKKRTSELKTKYSVKKRSLAEYNAFIPEHQRTRSHMENIRILIDSGKADNFYDALKM